MTASSAARSLLPMPPLVDPAKLRPGPGSAVATTFDSRTVSWNSVMNLAPGVAPVPSSAVASAGAGSTGADVCRLLGTVPLVQRSDAATQDQVAPRFCTTTAVGRPPLAVALASPRRRLRSSSGSTATPGSLIETLWRSLSVKAMLPALKLPRRSPSKRVAAVAASKARLRSMPAARSTCH